MTQVIAINGIFEYNFLDSNNELKTEQIGVINGSIWKNILSNEIKLTSAYDTWIFSNSKCSFSVYNDKLYIVNGKDYPWVYDGNLGIVSQLGAPFATASFSGNVIGLFSYAITYVTAGGEEVLGTISNIVNAVNNKVVLNIPLGYAGVTSRKIYRAYNGIYSNLDLLATVSDNTTLLYIDDVAYTPVVTPVSPIPDINNECPKPYFVKVFNNRLILTKCDKTPTQFFVSDAGLEVIDSANFVDISNYGDDNTPINGIEIEFSNVMVGSEKHWYLINIGTTITVSPTRVNVGIKDGYSLVRLPSFADFPGGLMFVSSSNDIRILNGLDALPVSTSLNNIRSDNWAQDIRGSLENDLKGYSNIYAIYYNYKYHLVLDGNKYVFDIRTQGWTYHSIETATYKSSPYILAVLNNELYNGQVVSDSTISDSNIVFIEKEYSSITYRGEDVPAYIESPEINVGDKYKYIEKLVIWFVPNEDNLFNITVITDDETEYTNSKEFQVLGGAFDASAYYPTDFEIAKDMDYRVYNIQKPVRWFKFKLENNVGLSSIQGWGVYTQQLNNKE